MEGGGFDGTSPSAARERSTSVTRRLLDFLVDSANVLVSPFTTPSPSRHSASSSMSTDQKGIRQDTSSTADAADKASSGQTATYTIRRAHSHETSQLAAIERSAGAAFRSYHDISRLADDEPMPVEVLRAYAEAGHLWVAVHELSSPPLDREGTTEASQELGKDSLVEEEAVVGFLAAFPIINAGSGKGRTRAQKRRSMIAGEGGGSAYLHIAELSVHAAHQKRGLGKMLIERMVADVRKSPFVNVPDRSEDASNGSSELRTKQQIEVRGLSLTTFKHLPFNAPFYARMGFREVEAGSIEDLVGTRGWELWREEQSGILRPEMRCWMVREL
jgi:ribosomal protein S18 acetylase RimI-like enzyme